MTRGLFTDIASVYDRMNALLSLGLDRRWRRAAVADAKGRPSRVLDLACGTGEFSFELARRFADAEVLGVDFAPAMLEIARQKNDSPRVRFEEGDASNLSALRDGSFELCSCAFGFRNFPETVPDVNILYGQIRCQMIIMQLQKRGPAQENFLPVPAPLRFFNQRLV